MMSSKPKQHCKIDRDEDSETETQLGTECGPTYKQFNPSSPEFKMPEIYSKRNDQRKRNLLFVKIFLKSLYTYNEVFQAITAHENCRALSEIEDKYPTPTPQTRLCYFTLLLRTLDWMKHQLQDRPNPAIAHGVALIFGLMCNVCPPEDIYSLYKLSESLLEECDKCAHDYDQEIEMPCLLTLYNKGTRFLQMFKILLSECKECKKHFPNIPKCLEEAEKWNKCSRSEDVLIQSLLNIRLMDRTHMHMFASVYWSVTVASTPERRPIKIVDEIIFFSGRKFEDVKKSDFQKFVQGFLENIDPNRRILHINISYKKSVGSEVNACCEPQILESLKKVSKNIIEIADSEKVEKTSINITLEETPCYECICIREVWKMNKLLHDELKHKLLGSLTINFKSLLLYQRMKPGEYFLQRLTNGDSGPLALVNRICKELYKGNRTERCCFQPHLWLYVKRVYKRNYNW